MKSISVKRTGAYCVCMHCTNICLSLRNDLMPISESLAGHIWRPEWRGGVSWFRRRSFRTVLWGEPGQPSLPDLMEAGKYYQRFLLFKNEKRWIRVCRLRPQEFIVLPNLVLFQVLRFRSKFITEELAQVFMDTDSEEEFEGFSKEDDSLCNSWMSPMVTAMQMCVFKLGSNMKHLPMCV